MKFTLEFVLSNKFTQHIAYDLVAYGAVDNYIPGELFDKFYSDEENENHKYIFCASTINSETIGFIRETPYPNNVFLYFDKLNKSLYKDASDRGVKCLVGAKDFATIKNPKSCIKLDHYYSEYLLNILDRKKTIPNIDIITSLYSLNKIPEEIESIIYPNSNLNIKMFDGYEINHPQNLGFLDDLSFIELINNCQLLIAINNIYLPYALLLQKQAIAMESNNWIKKTALTKEILEDRSKIPEPSLSIQDIRNNSYKNFIEKYIL
jgi:hypothetical protein